MSLSTPRSFFGVHSFSPYNRADGTFYGIMKVLASSTLSFSGTMVNLTGGSAKFPWDTQEGPMAASLQLKAREYPDWVFQLFSGLTPTENAADALGNVSSLTNKQGTSVQKATTGIASIAVKTASEGDLKFGKYVLKATDATHIDVYFSSDADLSRGNAGTYQTDTLKVTVSPLLVPSTGSTVDIPNFGLTLTGGSGTVAFVPGDTATFEVRPKNSGSMVGVIGSVTGLFPEFGAIIMSKKKGTGELFEIDMYRGKGEGVPLHFEENKYSELDVKITPMYDAAQDGVCRMRLVTPLTAN